MNTMSGSNRVPADRIPTMTRLAVMCLGAQSTLAQVALLRAGLERFGGNEFFMGVALAAWLAAGALGAALFGRIGDRRGGGRILAAIGSGMVTAGMGIGLIILSTLSVRFSVTGMAMHPLAAMAWMAAATAPAAVVSGVLFAWLVPMLAATYGAGLGRTTILESVGAGIGGLVVGSLAVEWIGTPGLVAAVALTGGFAALGLAGIKRLPCRVATIAGTLVVAAACAWASWLIVPAPAGSVIISRVENRFGRRAAVVFDRQKTVVQGPSTVIDCPDRRTPEILATMVKGLSPDARRILAAGGTSHDLAMLASIPDTEVTLMTRDIALDNLDRDFCRSDRDRAVTVIPGDFLYEISGVSAGLDAIILRVGPPATLDRTGLVTSNTFWKAAAALKRDGRLFVTLGAAESHPTDAAIRSLASILNAARGAFPECRLLPFGDWLLTCGRTAPNLKAIKSALDVLPFERMHATDAFIDDVLDPFELEQLDRRIESVRRDVPANSAMLPAAQLYTLLDWAGRHNPSVATAGSTPGRLPAAAACILFPAIIMVLALSRRLRGRMASAYATSAVTGICGMAVEFALMWAIQSSWGSLAGWLGGIIAAYMGGLGAGAWVAWRLLDRRGASPTRTMKAFNAGAAISTIATIPVVLLAASGIPSAAGLVLVLVLAFTTAAFCGGAFQSAAQGLRDSSALGTCDLTGRIRAVDTMAAATAAIACPILLFPIIGVVAPLAASGVACFMLALHKID